VVGLTLSDFFGCSTDGVFFLSTSFWEESGLLTGFFEVAGAVVAVAGCLVLGFDSIRLWLLRMGCGYGAAYYSNCTTIASNCRTLSLNS